MSVWFRHCDRRYPYLWETDSQPAARWHDTGQGPVQYLASTPDGAWAEFLRHEEITDLDDLAGIHRALWMVEVDDDAEAVMPATLPDGTLRGGAESYPACRAEAQRLRAAGATALDAPSAALATGRAGGQLVRGGLAEAPDRSGRVLALFGGRPDIRGYVCAADASPTQRVLGSVRPL